MDHYYQVVVKEILKWPIYFLIDMKHLLLLSVPFITFCEVLITQIII